MNAGRRYRHAPPHEPGRLLRDGRDVRNVTPARIAQGRRICDIVCVQNHYNVAHRGDDALIDALARDGIAYVPYFSLGGFSPLQSSTQSDVAARRRCRSRSRGRCAARRTSC